MSLLSTVTQFISVFILTSVTRRVSSVCHFIWTALLLVKCYQNGFIHSFDLRIIVFISNTRYGPWNDLATGNFTSLLRWPEQLTCTYVEVWQSHFPIIKIFLFLLVAVLQSRLLTSSLLDQHQTLQVNYVPKRQVLIPVTSSHVSLFASIPASVLLNIQLDR